MQRDVIQKWIIRALYGCDRLLTFLTGWLNMEPIYRTGGRYVFRLLYRLEYIDFDKIPLTGPAIIIANHVSYIDGILINAGINRNVRFIVDKYIYHAPLVHYFMTVNRAIPIAPNKQDVSIALDMIAEGLAQGDMVCIFPEGQLTYTGNLGRFRPGIEWIVSRTPVRVYPIAVEGLWGSIFSRKYRKSQFKHTPWSFRRTIRLRCGNPISPEDVKVDYLQKVIMELKRTL